MTAPYRLQQLEETDSTNERARLAAEAGVAGDLWIVARQLTGGRGRLGRSWRSPVGNFYGSLLLRPEMALAQVGSLSLVMGLAVAEAVHEVSAGRIVPRLKWPNDVLVDGAKLAGILLEGGERPEKPGCWLVIGVGLNILSAPQNLAYAATSLVDLGVLPPTPEAFLAILDAAFRRRYRQWSIEGMAALREAWLASAIGMGQRVTLLQGNRRRTGLLVDLATDGAIWVAFDDGQGQGDSLERIHAGEIILRH